MMIEAFEKRTGCRPTLKECEAIERTCVDFDGEKDALCKACAMGSPGTSSARPT